MEVLKQIDIERQSQRDKEMKTLCVSVLVYTEHVTPPHFFYYVIVVKIENADVKYMLRRLHLLQIQKEC